MPPDVADSLARQRCEQTLLLQAMAWALRQVGNSKAFMMLICAADACR
jgi:hypothetical protein